jgi:hypothetical protein
MLMIALAHSGLHYERGCFHPPITCFHCIRFTGGGVQLPSRIEGGVVRGT